MPNSNTKETDYLHGKGIKTCQIPHPMLDNVNQTNSTCVRGDDMN
jgi:hypothetical protein